MRNTLLTFALMTTMAAYVTDSPAGTTSLSDAEVMCQGGHKCDSTCKKDKDGNCIQAKTQSGQNGNATTVKNCCIKGEKNCSGKKGKSRQNGNKNGKGKGMPKS